MKIDDQFDRDSNERGSFTDEATVEEMEQNEVIQIVDGEIPNIMQY